MADSSSRPLIAAGDRPDVPQVESARGSDGAPAAGEEHEAAAGPQPDDSGPVLPAPSPEPRASAQLRVGIQAGHWKNADLPDELASLRGSTGTAGEGKTEAQLNLDIAQRVAVLLEAQGIQVDVLPATVPPRYQADAFVALHADGNASSSLSGYKLARSTQSAVPRADDALLAKIAAEYQKATGLPKDGNVTRNMTAYYAFNSRRLTHTIAPTTPAVILEMGFMTNPSDLRTLLGKPDVVANGIARGILGFLKPAQP